MSFKDFKESKRNKDGFKGENIFKETFKDIIINHENGNINDMQDHYDFMLKGDIKIDVKYRTNKEIWIEFRTTENTPGWLFGKADYFGFYIKPINKWYFIRQVHLAYAAGRLTKNLEIYETISKAKYGRYRREGNKDIIMLIDLKDLKSYGLLTTKQFLKKININN